MGIAREHDRQPFCASSLHDFHAVRRHVLKTRSRSPFATQNIDDKHSRFRYIEFIGLLPGSVLRYGNISHHVFLPARLTHLTLMFAARIATAARCVLRGPRMRNSLTRCVPAGERLRVVFIFSHFGSALLLLRSLFHKLGANARLSLALARLGIGRSSRRGDGSSRNAHALRDLPVMAVHTSRLSWPIGRFRMRPMRAHHVRFARFNLLASAMHGLLRFLANSQCVWEISMRPDIAGFTGNVGVRPEASSSSCHTAPWLNCTRIVMYSMASSESRIAITMR